MYIFLKTLNMITLLKNCFTCNSVFFQNKNKNIQKIKRNKKKKIYVL